MQDVPLWRLRPPRVCGKTEVGGRTKCLVTFVSFRIPHIREDTHNHLYAPSTRLTFAKIPVPGKQNKTNETRIPALLIYIRPLQQCREHSLLG